MTNARPVHTKQDQRDNASAAQIDTGIAALAATIRAAQQA